MQNELKIKDLYNNPATRWQVENLIDFLTKRKI